VHNARALVNDYRELDEDLWSRFNRDAGRAGTLWYYRRLAAVLSERLASTGTGAALAGELARTVDVLVNAVETKVGAATMRADADWALEREAHVLALLDAG
jgi:hypothetical protein